MVKNESNLGRIIRGVVGVALVRFALFGSAGNMVLWVVALVIGAVRILTAAIGFCPIYKVLGIKTNK